MSAQSRPWQPAGPVAGADGRPERSWVGPYELLAPIGEGGMGVVHLARGPDGRRVALKVLRPHVVGDRDARERLAREVAALGRIHSPRIAQILDADPHGPVPYVAMRYVPGLSLYHHVEEEGLVEGADLLHFADALAEALQAVHAVGVVHRDVKPTNVLMEGRSPVLIDFGLARAAEDAQVTVTGWVMGTPNYLAPEILYGEEPSPAADVHAWAATVAFAATGRAPYGTGPVVAVTDRIRRGEHDLRGVPDPIAALLRGALSAEPGDRPSVAGVRAWLEEERERRHLARQGIIAPAGPSLRPAAVPLTQPVAPSEPQPAPQTRILPAAPTAPTAPPAPMRTSGLPPPYPSAAPSPRPAPSRTQQLLQLTGLGLLTGATVAYAPYLGTALVGLVVLLARTVSVTRQRHSRRRLLRGRPRWYDVPTTTLSLPGYAALALLGAVADVLIALLGGLGLLAAGYLLWRPPTTMLLMAAAGFVPALWWGPGSSRLREIVRDLTGRNARTEFGGWLLAAMALLGSAVLVSLMFSHGINWAPYFTAPWR